MCTRWWIAHIFSLILPTAVYIVHITYQWQRCNGLQKSNGNLTLITLHFWFTFESFFECIRWIFDPKKKDQGQNTLRLNLKVLPLLACHALQFTVSLFKVKMKIGAWSIYIWTKRGEADYECSKCNFYYTSIILLLITDSFSLRSSSKTRSYSIHMHTGGDKEIGEAIWNV